MSIPLTKATSWEYRPGTFLMWLEYRLSYTRMVSSLELTGSMGYVPANDSDEEDDGPLDDMFESILSGGTGGAEYLQPPKDTVIPRMADIFSELQAVAGISLTTMTPVLSRLFSWV